MLEVIAVLGGAVALATAGAVVDARSVRRNANWSDEAERRLIRNERNWPIQ